MIYLTPHLCQNNLTRVRNLQDVSLMTPPAFIQKRSQPREDGTYSTLYLYYWLYTYIRPYLLRAIVALFISIPIGSLDAAIAYSIKPLMDKNEIAHAHGYIPFVIVGFTVCQGILNWFWIYLNGWLGYRLVNNIRTDLFKKLQTMDVQFFDQNGTGFVIQRFSNDAATLQTGLLENSKGLLTRSVSAVALSCVLLYTSWKLAIVAIGILLLIVYPTTRLRKIIRVVSHQINNLSSEMLTFYNETTMGIRVVYSYNLASIRLKEFNDYQRDLLNKYMKFIKLQGWLTPSTHIIASIGIAVIIWFGFQEMASGSLTAGAFASFIIALILLFNPIKNLGGMVMRNQTYMMAVGRLIDIFKIQPTIQDKENAIVLNGVNQGISFENVCFSYTPDRPVLHHINLTFKKGETVALVGNSGGGKTTVANLIPRFYDVQEGAIKIDGVDLRDLSLDSLRQHIGLVTQENFLFNGSIRDNLLYGKPNASETEINDALEKAFLSDFVANQPDGLDTLIGERGVLLSGGQKQRLAIARALLKDAPIVILDEATSALDNQSEAIVQKAIEALMRNRTVIVIAHRLSTIRNADRIVVLSEGRITEEGTHNQLISQGGTYAMLYNTQFKDLSLTSPESTTESKETTVAV